MVVTLWDAGWAQPGLECVGWSQSNALPFWLTGWGSPLNEEVGKGSVGGGTF